MCTVEDILSWGHGQSKLKPAMKAVTFRGLIVVTVVIGVSLSKSTRIMAAIYSPLGAICHYQPHSMCHLVLWMSDCMTCTKFLGNCQMSLMGIRALHALHGRGPTPFELFCAVLESRLFLLILGISFQQRCAASYIPGRTHGQQTGDTEVLHRYQRAVLFSLSPTPILSTV